MPVNGEDDANQDGPFNLLLAPAERADLVIDFNGVSEEILCRSQGQSQCLADHVERQCERFHQVMFGDAEEPELVFRSPVS
jgi:hypothetical protein